VTTNAKHERFAELDVELNRLFDGHDDAIIHRQMAHFISQVMKDAPERIEQAFGPGEKEIDASELRKLIHA
jgi:hypothetical protein